MKNRLTCSSWLHARPGEQLGLSPRSSGRVGGLSVGAERTRRSSKGVRLPGRGSRKRSSAPGCRRGSGAARIVGALPYRYRATGTAHLAMPVEIKRHYYQKSKAIVKKVGSPLPVEGRLQPCHKGSVETWALVLVADSVRAVAKAICGDGFSRRAEAQRFHRRQGISRDTRLNGGE